MLLRSVLFVFCCLLSLSVFAQPGSDLVDARAGKCYAKCLVRDKYETVTEQVMTRPPSVEASVVPATFETVNGYYVAKETYRRLVAVPPVFETVTEKVLIAPPGRKTKPDAYEAVEERVLSKPAVKTFQIVDAVFKTVDAEVEIEPTYMNLEVLPMRFKPLLEQIEVRPASTKWVKRKADRNCLSADPDDCFVWCMVEVPPQYQTLYKQIPVGCDGNGSTDCERYMPVAGKTVPRPRLVVEQEAKARELVEPAEYKTITKWVLKAGATDPGGTGEGEYQTISRKVLKRAARLQEEIVPAEYKRIQKKRIATPATIKSEPVPAEYLTITKRVLIRKGGFSQWREIICGEKMTGYTVQQIQQALKALGYYKGQVDGAMTTRTKTAIANFQRERDLPSDGNVDYETLKALGISL